MKPISLRLRSFRGIRAGMGKEEISIDFSSLPSGIIAITGGNGTGKTTVLDNLHPFRIMPYKLRKAKDWSPGSFSYYEECYGSDAEKEFIYEMNQKTYRTLILIDADRRKQEAYLYLKDGDSWRPLNDGKVKTYDAAVEEIMGSPTLFFTSVFRAQGAKNLSDYARGDIMGLISELLNIDHIKLQGDKARKVTDTLKSLSITDQTRLSALKDELATEDGLKEGLASTVKLIKDVESSLAVAKNNLDVNATMIAEGEKKKMVRESELTRLSDLNNLHSQDVEELRELDRKVVDIATKNSQAQDKLRSDFKEAEAEATAEISALEKELSEKKGAWDIAHGKLTAHIGRAEKISSNGAEIRNKVLEETGTKKLYAQMKADLVKLDGEREELSKKEKQLADVKGAITRTEADIRVLQSRHSTNIQRQVSSIEQAEKEAGKLQGLDCVPGKVGSINEQCRFIRDAVIAKSGLPGLKEELARLQKPNSEMTKLTQNLEKLQADEKDLYLVPPLVATCNDAIQAIRKAIADTEQILAKVAEWTKLIPELEQAERNLEQWKKELDNKGKEFDTLSTHTGSKIRALLEKMSLKLKDLETKLSIVQGESKSECEALAVKKAAISERLNTRSQEIARLRTSTQTDCVAELATLAAQTVQIKSNIADLEATIRSLVVRAGVFESKLEALNGKHAEANSLETKLDRFNKEIAKFTLLAKGCSNDGIIALEIDDAGPNISALTNDLLTNCYGPRFAVRFETQSQKNDGSMKEDFDITVFDAETDENKSITVMSGGQVTWIEDAITRAVCLFNIHRSDRSFDTLFTDEKDGALDNVRKAEFMAVKRRALELGTHSREFFITQTPELQDMADARITITKEGIALS